MPQNDFRGTAPTTPYVYQEFPRWLYHDDHEPKLVEDVVARDVALAEGWRVTVEAPVSAPVSDRGDGHRNVMPLPVKRGRGRPRKMTA